MRFWRKQRPVSELVQEILNLPTGPAQIRFFVRQGLFIALGVIALYLLAPRLLDVMSSAPRLRTIRAGWFGAMFASQLLSFTCVWWLVRLVLPQVGWFVASTSQITANAVSRVIPGGAAVGGATLHRMLSVSGVSIERAAGALAASSIISTSALFAIPTTGLLLAFLGAPVPESLLGVALAGGVLFVLFVGVGVVGILTTKPLIRVERLLSAGFALTSRWFGTKWTIRRGLLVEERDRLASVVGRKWPKVIFAAAVNWAFDYLTLVFALYAVGADPRLSLVLLAYAGAAVLAMIPITPGGLGFVESWLTSLLVVSGISTQNALLATLAYRIFALWMPLLAGVPAWISFRARYGQLLPSGKSLAVEKSDNGV